MPTSIIIPSRQEKFLNHTIKDVLKNATGTIEVFPILDGYEPDELIEDKRVKYIRLEPNSGMQKRHGINQAVSQSQYEHIMALDAHCMVARGFDSVLERDCEENWVMIPRRLRLDAENWCVQAYDGRPPIDYEYWKWQDFKKGGLHGYRWDSRTLERLHIPIDDSLHFQGSCYFMHKAFFNRMGFMHIEGYGGFTQEAEEIALTTWLNGGRVKVNKNTSYAHLHKGKKYGRMYKFNWEEKKAGDAYSYDLFVNKNRKAFAELINSFMPIPNWPEDWEKTLK